LTSTTKTHIFWVTQLIPHSGRAMAKAITGDQLRKAVEDQTFIKGGDVASAEGVKYDFRLSPRMLKAKFGRPVNASHLTEVEMRDLEIEPGEVVFVLSEERLELPSNMVAHLSPKRKLSHAGVLTLGGFMIDPNYRGRLLVGLFNLSATPFPLIPLKKLIAAIFYVLDDEELGEFPKSDESLDDFPDELIQVMRKYEPMAVQSVSHQVDKLTEELRALKSDIRSHEDWYKRFETSLEHQQKQIENLVAGLQTEKDVRQKGEDTLTQAVQSIDRKLWWLRGAAWVVIAIVIPLLIAWLVKTFGFTKP